MSSNCGRRYASGKRLKTVSERSNSNSERSSTISRPRTFPTSCTREAKSISSEYQVAPVLTKEFIESWLVNQPPKSEFSMLSLSETKTIAKTRPHYKYDLLPVTLRNETFYINFDMETAKSRFIIHHRSASCSFLDLPVNDKITLLQIVLSFARKFNFHDSFLTIPGGCENMVNVVYPTFYAYLVVRDIKQYIEVFREAVNEHKLLSWPLIKRWKTCFWLADTLGYQSINIFLESVRFNSSVYSPAEFGIMTRRATLHSIQSDTTAPLELLTDISLHNWEEKHVIGVRSFGISALSKDPVDRWQLLQLIDEKVQSWQAKEPDLRCWLSVPLMFEFQLQDNRRADGLIRFPDGVPIFLKLSKKPIVKPVVVGTGLNAFCFVERSIRVFDNEWVCIDMRRVADDKNNQRRHSARVQRNDEFLPPIKI